MFEVLKLGSRVLKSNFSTLPEPYKVTFAVTYNCNSKCKTCNIWKKKPKGELTIEEIKKIFSKISPSWLNITGGEPFLRNDIYKIAKIAKEYGVSMLNLTTNGLVPRAFEESKKISKLKFFRFVVTVSMDGPEEIHDKIRGIKGNWKRAIKLYKNLKKIKASGFQTYLGYTISKYNLGMIEKTIKDSGFDIRDFHFNIFHSSFYYDINGKSDGRFLNDIKYVIKNKKSIGMLSYIERIYIKHVEKYLKTGKSPFPCKALTSSCFIDPQGNVYPCTHWEMKLGNLRESDYDLKKIWNSKKAKEARKMIKKNKCPGCWTPCEAYQTILGNLLRM